MLTFFDRVKTVSGVVWEKFEYLGNNSINKVESDKNRGITRGHTLEIISSLSKGSGYFDYESYEFKCNYNDKNNDFNTLKKVQYINFDPMDKDDNNVKYGEISVASLPLYDESFKHIDKKNDLDRTINYLLSLRKKIFFKYGFDWVRAVVASLENNEVAIELLRGVLENSKEFEFMDNLRYLLESGFEFKDKLNKIINDTNWIYD